MSTYGERHNELLDTLADAAASITNGAIRAMDGERVGESMLETLASIGQARLTLDAAERQAVTQLRSAGVTWQTIADTLGMSRQAAHERFSRDEV